MKEISKKIWLDFLNGKVEGYVSRRDLETWYNEAENARMNEEETELYIAGKIEQEFKNAERHSIVAFLGRTVLLILVAKLLTNFIFSKFKKNNPA